MFTCRNTCASMIVGVGFVYDMIGRAFGQISCVVYPLDQRQLWTAVASFQNATTRTSLATGLTNKRTGNKPCVFCRLGGFSKLASW